MQQYYCFTFVNGACKEHIPVWTLVTAQLPLSLNSKTLAQK